MRRYAMTELGTLTGGTDPALPEPAATPLGEALNAVAAAAHAASQIVLPPGGLWPLLGRLGLAGYLAPAPGG